MGWISVRYDVYLFDFDGTIADTGEGIRRSVAYSLERLGYDVPEKAVLDRFIGPPLHDTYVALFDMTDEQAERAVQVYRERYLDIGLYESWLYPGIAELLKALHDGGAWVGLASAKPQMMVERLSERFSIAPYLNVISGTGLDRHSADKRDLLLRALPDGADRRRACMAGDRRFDIEAARDLGIAAVGANYGYAPPGELRQAGADVVFDDVAAMAKWMLGEG